MTTSDTRSLGESTKDHGAGAAACKDFSVQELDAAGSPAPGSSCAAIVPQLGAMGLGCTDDLGAIGLSGASACDMCCDTCGAEACGVSTRRAYPAGHGDSYVVGCPRVEWTSDYAVKKKSILYRM